MPDTKTFTVTHIAGPTITICGRSIQRCPWCGFKLRDNKGEMTQAPEHEESPFMVFPSGRMVRVATDEETRTTNYTVLADTNELPPDSCEGMVED
jgi:hypothetical protein